MAFESDSEEKIEPLQPPVYTGDLENENLNNDDITRAMTHDEAVSVAMSVTEMAIPNHLEINKFREGAFMMLMWLTMLVTQASAAQTMNIGTQIGETFHVADKPGELSWFSAAFSLTVGTFILISGRLGDMYGYKNLYLIGMAWYGVWSVVAGFTAYVHSSPVFFQTVRALQGIGPAIMFPNSQALIVSFYPPSTKQLLCLALFGAIAPGGFIFGSLFAGMFAQLAWWPWDFWMGGMVSLVLLICGQFIIPKNVGARSGGTFDYLGSFTGVTGLVLINFSLNQGPNVGWDTPYVYVLFIVGFLFIAAFFVVEKRVKDPLVPPEVLQGETGFVLGCIAAGWACFGVWVFYTFKWSEMVDGDSPVLAGVKSLPAVPMGYVAAISTALLLGKVQLPSSFVMLISMLCFFIGVILQATRPVGQIYWGQKFVSFLVSPFGMDMSFPAGCIIIVSVLPRSKQGIAGSLVATFVNYSISIGLGLAGAVEYYTTRHLEPSFETTVKGIRHAFYMGVGLAGFGVVLSVLFIIMQHSGRRQKKIDDERTASDESQEKASDESEVKA